MQPGASKRSSTQPIIVNSYGMKGQPQQHCSNQVSLIASSMQAHCTQHQATI